MSPSSQYKFLRQAPRDGLSTAAQPSRWQQLHIDPWLCSFLVLNALLGLTVLYSASAQDVGLVSKQAMSFGIGFVVMFSLAQIPQRYIRHFHLIFMCLVYFP
jgi:rod shape determining protein RodA